MAARVRYWVKFERDDRFLVEIKIHEVGTSHRYPDGVKLGLVCVDIVSGRKLLMDNHHPKGPHIHLPGREFPYCYTDDDKLIEDFRALIWDQFGVKL